MSKSTTEKIHQEYDDERLRAGTNLLRKMMEDGGRFVRKARRRKRSTAPKPTGIVVKGTILKYLLKPNTFKDDLGLVRKRKSEDLVGKDLESESELKPLRIMSTQDPNMNWNGAKILTLDGAGCGRRKFGGQVPRDLRKKFTSNKP